MAELPEYVLNLQGLRRGLNKTRFKLEDDFFNSFEYGLVKNGSVDVVLNAELDGEHEILIDASLKGELNCTCDRCTRDISFPFESEGRLLVRMAESDLEDTDEIWYRSPIEKKIDLADFLYELISLSKPLKVICDQIEGEQCNEEAMKLLEKYMKGNKQSTEENPIWEQLKGLKFDN